MLLMERSKADKLGLKYHLKYEGGAMAGCDPTIMGIGPVPAVKRLLGRKGHESQRYRYLGIQRGFCQSGIGLRKRFGNCPERAFRKRQRLGRRFGAWPSVGRKRMPSGRYHEFHHEDRLSERQILRGYALRCVRKRRRYYVQQSLINFLANIDLKRELFY